VTVRLRALSRRSFLVRVTGSAAAVGGSLAFVGGDAWGQGPPGQSRQASPPRQMVVDADPNDPARSGTTDSDSGSSADRAGNGRRPLQSGSSTAPNAAPANPPANARPPGPAGRTGTTNSDPGDPPGNGRTGMTNSDPSDRPYYGRAAGAGAVAPPRPQRIVICPGSRRCPR
jgi:hypothetical protein